MALKTNSTILILLVGFLASACAAPTSDRIADKDPVKCFWVQSGSNVSNSMRMAIINTTIDPKTDPSRLIKGEYSRLSNRDMEIFILELEGQGFFKAARPSPPQGTVKYVSLHIPNGNYYVVQNVTRTVYNKAVKAFTVYWNVGDTRFMTGSATGEAPVDFEKQKEQMQRTNQEQMERIKREQGKD